MAQDFSPELTIRQENGSIIVERPTDLRHHKALHGLTRALLGKYGGRRFAPDSARRWRFKASVIRPLYRAKNLQLRLGHSHEVLVEPPAEYQL